MKSEYFYLIGAIGLIIAKFRPKIWPKKSAFSCAGCKKRTQHNDRTTTAHQWGELSFYCDDCEKMKSEGQIPKAAPRLLD